MMEIKYLKNSDIDREKWDACVKNAFNTRIYAMSWYLDAVSFYWDALVADDYAMVFPLTYYKKFGMNVLRQPINAQQLGIFSKKALDHDAILRFLRSIPKKFIFGTLHLNAGNVIKVNKEFPVEYRVNIELKIDKSIEQLRKEYIRNNRRNILKAQKNSIVIRRGSDFGRIIDTFRDNLGKKRYRVSKNSYTKVYGLCAVLQQKEALLIYDAYDETGDFVAGIMLITFQNRMIALFSGCTETGYKIFASHYLFDYSIEQAARQNKEVFDFEGSETESVAFVFHGFGGVTVPYPVITVSHIPKVFVKLFFALKKIFRK
ncbi:MAG: GNAT family N-acetyltransferase [Bacteroidales bacterium]|jgi:hypothetical protein|nr:GNAT family N-acetyltransferase [Bacteroidales bacterium]